MGKVFKKRLILAAIAVLVSKSVWADNGVDVVIKAPWNTPTQETLYLCDSDASCSPLKLQSHLTYTGKSRDQGQSFTVVRGDLKTPAVDSNGKEISLKLNSGLNVFSVTNWKDLPPLGLIGDVRKFRSFYSPQLNNFRDISVWLPPDYENSKASYPVIYMHDGQNVFDPLTSTTGIDWRVDDIMQGGHLPPAIVVAVDCIKDKRYDEYDYTVKGVLYSRFLIESVKPFIDLHFRTRPQREFTYTMGASMGGLISLALIWKHPEVFSKGAGLSLPVYIHNKSIYNVINSSPMPTEPIAFYMDHGGYNDDSKYEALDRPFAEYLLTLGFNSENFIYDVDQYGDHREVDWARRVGVPLNWLLKSPGFNTPRILSENLSNEGLN